MPIPFQNIKFMLKHFPVFIPNLIIQSQSSREYQEPVLSHSIFFNYSHSIEHLQEWTWWIINFRALNWLVQRVYRSRTIWVTQFAIWFSFPWLLIHNRLMIGSDRCARSFVLPSAPGALTSLTSLSFFYSHSHVHPTNYRLNLWNVTKTDFC